MAVTYFVVTLAILVYNFREIPNALATIVQSAFGLRAVGGGAIGSMMIAMQMGVARGIFLTKQVLVVLLLLLPLPLLMHLHSRVLSL